MVSVTVMGKLGVGANVSGNDKLEGEVEAVIPMPEPVIFTVPRLTVVVEKTVVTVRVALCADAALGANTTLIVQLAPIARLVPQVLVWL